MFDKKKLNDLELEVLALQEELKGYKENRIEDIMSLKSCEVCGCLLKLSNAVKGRGEIREREQQIYIGGSYYHLTNLTEDYIYYPYYCKIHKPKEKK